MSSTFATAVSQKHLQRRGQGEEWLITAERESERMEECRRPRGLLKTKCCISKIKRIQGKGRSEISQEEKKRKGAFDQGLKVVCDVVARHKSQAWLSNLSSLAK